MIFNDFFSEDEAMSANPAVECPLDTDELGNATWRFLHTTAAYYPHEPTADEQQWALDLIISLSKLYPCPHCAPDFRSDAAAHSAAPG